MSEREQGGTAEAVEDVFEQGFGDFADADLDVSAPFSSEKQRVAAMRRRLERRLEEKRLREELGDYDLELDDF